MFTDIEFEFCTDSGLSSTLSLSPNCYQEPVFFPEEVAVYGSVPLSMYYVELVPVYTWPAQETVATAPSTDVQPSHPQRRLVKWTLPPPAHPATTIPGWSPMP